MASAVVGALKVLLQADTAAFEAKLKGADQNVVRLANRLKQDLEPSQRAVNTAVRQFLGTREIGMAEAYAKAVTEIGGATRLTASDQQRVNRAVTEALAHYKALGQEAPAHLKKLATETQAAAQSTTGLSSAMSTMKGAMGAFGITLGATGLISFGQQVFAAADEIGDLALKMGVSTDAAQRFQIAARQSGAEIEDVSAAVVKMNDKLAEGDKSTVAALDDAGLSFQQIRNMKPEDAFRAISDAIGRIPDPMKQAQLAMELFGKAGANLLPMIKENSLSAADAVEVMSEDQIAALKDAQQAWENFFNFLIRKSGTALAEVGLALKNMAAIISGGPVSTPTKGPAPRTWTDFLNPTGVLQSVASQNFNAALEPFALRDKAIADARASMPGVKSPLSFFPGADPLLTKANAGVKELLTNLIKSTEASDKLAESMKRMAEARQARVDVMTGVKLREDILEFAEDLKLMESQGGVAKEEIDSVVKTIEKFIQAGAPIPANVMSWFSGHVLSTVMDGTDHIQQALFKTGISFQQLERAARTSMGNLIKPTDWKALMSGGLSVSDLMAGVNMKGQSMGQLFGAGFKDFTGDMSGKIMRAITGGGDISKTLGSLFGTDILGKMTGSMGSNGMFDQGLGKMLQGSFLGKKIGGFVGSLIPGVGALLGPAMSALFGKIGSIGQNTTLKDRQAFAEQRGFSNLNALLDELGASGPGGRALADKAMRGIGRGDTDANKKWMKDVAEFFDKQAKNIQLVSEKLGQAQAALAAFGGSAPKSMRPLIDELLKSSKLTADQRKLLEGMSKAPSWQTIQQRAQDLGIDLGSLGPAFAQARIKDTGFGLLHDIEMFVDQGADRDAVLTGMADELSALAAEAVRTGRALPKALEMYVRRLQEMGLLLDDQGNAITEGLIFAEMEDESLKAVVSVLEEIRDLLSAPTTPPGDGPRTGPGDDDGARARPRQPGFRNPFNDGFGGGDLAGIGLPSFAAGSHGQYMDFGPGTPVMLHGRERIMTEGEALGSSGSVYHINAIDAASFETFLRRGGADAVARTLPDASARYVGKR